MRMIKGLWRRYEPTRVSGPGGRFLLWLFCFTAAGLGVWFLSELFPGRLSTGSDRAYLLYSVAVLTVVSASVIFTRGARWRETARNLAIWTVIAAVLISAFTFKNEFNGALQRVRSELNPGEPLSTGPKELVLSRSVDGHFYAMGTANGVRVRFLIDTGATDTVLNRSDAERIGVDAGKLTFTRSYETANGVALGAPYTLAVLIIGPVRVPNMPVSVNQAEMGSSLLGMSFLRRLSSFEIRGDRLFLRWS
jgi:aspartyl protease family protein